MSESTFKTVKNTALLLLIIVGVLLYLYADYKVNESQVYDSTVGRISAIYMVTDPITGVGKMRAAARYTVNDVEYICELPEYVPDWQIGDKRGVRYDKRFPSVPLADRDPARNALKTASMYKLLACVMWGAAAILLIIRLAGWIDHRKALKRYNSLPENER